MSEDIRKRCVAIFRDVSGIGHSGRLHSASDDQLLSEPISSLDVDSLTMIEFIMKVEDDFDVLLDEQAVNGCRNITELVDLVAASRHD